MKLIMFDLDGTLLSNMQDISEFNRKAFRELNNKGYHLGIATGRRVSNVEEILGEDVKYFDVLIGENGHQTKNLKTNQDIYTRKISEQEILEIIELFDDPTKDVNFCHFNDEGTFCYRKTTFSENMEKELDRVIFYQEGKPFPALPKICMPVGSEYADEYRQRVENLENDFYHGAMTGYGFFEFMSKETSKWKALKKYMDENHYKIEDTMAFGDSGNDMEILSNVGFAVAMQNADGKVKAICHDVTDYCYDEDGVGKYIKDKILVI